jgi:16S rRNA (adenine1518-N6/adenine1519-N6)-dimethyltransferase
MSPGEVRSALEALGITPSRRLGQSFLVSEEIAERTAAECRCLNVLEIGPGLGALTGELLAVASRVTAVEISQKLCDYLSERICGPRFALVRGDFLKTDPSRLPGYPFEAVAGNLPYSISSPALVRLASADLGSVRKVVVMLQAEVAVRAMTLTGGREYGRLALALWPHFTVRKLLDTGPSAFYPQPEVRSRVVVLERRTEAVVRPEKLDSFSRLVRVGFASRRKTLLNNLASVIGRPAAEDILSRAAIEASTRAEDLAPEVLAGLAEMVKW